MGYYSDIVLTLPQVSRRKFEAFLCSEAGRAARDMEFDEKYPRPWCGSVLRNRKKTETYYVWQGVKWYEDFDEVRAIHAFLDTLPSSEYLFQILGEDFGDYETDGTYMPEEYFTVRWEFTRPKGVSPEDIPHQGYSSFEAWQTALFLENDRELYDMVHSILPHAFTGALHPQEFVKSLAEELYRKVRNMNPDGKKIRKEHVLEYVEGEYDAMKKALESS